MYYRDNRVAATSGSGGCYCGGQGGLSDAAALAAGAVAGFLLYQAITMAAAGRRKRSDRATSENKFAYLWDLMYAGLEEFEGKVDKIAAGQEDNSWISKLYQNYNKTFGGVDEDLKTKQFDGLEPPMLDETWGLMDSPNITEDFHEDVRFESLENNNLGDPIMLEGINSMEETAKCTKKFLQCVSQVLQGNVNIFIKPDGLLGFVKKSIFKVAFHGKYGNVWAALMTIPQIRDLVKCDSQKKDCISYEIIRQEASATIEEETPRLFVDPEFLQSQDESDGSLEFDAIENGKMVP